MNKPCSTKLINNSIFACDLNQAFLILLKKLEKMLSIQLTTIQGVKFKQSFLGAPTSQLFAKNRMRIKIFRKLSEIMQTLQIRKKRLN